VILPLIFLYVMNLTPVTIGLSGQLIPFLQQVVVGVSIGVIVGFLLVSVIKHSPPGDLQLLEVISAAVIAYVAAELLRGNGVLSVAVFGLFFGNWHGEHKIELERFTSLFSNILTILVFVLLGTILVIPSPVILGGTLLFLIYLVLRGVAVHVFLKEYALKEKLFVSLNVPKGVGLAVVVLLMTTTFQGVAGIRTLTSLGLLFIMYSVVLSTVATTLGVDLLNIKKS
jgi:NhaP-type Na+/H+ or K+/H+ antiporter